MTDATFGYLDREQFHREPSPPPMPPWAQPDAIRADSAPRALPIRNTKRGVMMGRQRRQRQFETGVMDLEG